jgi:short-subunit dehydrogenase
MEFKNKTILITGASSGIGFELCRQLAKEGCKIALLARRKEKLDELAKIINNSGSEALAVQCDVAKKEEIHQAFEKVKETFGMIDIAVLNSGVSAKNLIEEFDAEKAKELFDINVMGIVYCAEELLPDFIKRKEGVIVGVSSLAEGRGFPKNGFYSGSKAAVTKILESMRIDLKKYNVKVIIVKPGFVKTPMTDKNDFMMPFMLSVEKGTKIIVEGMRKDKKIIQFPLPTVIGAKLLRIIPDSLFDKIAERVV